MSTKSIRCGVFSLLVMMASGVSSVTAQNGLADHPSQPPFTGQSLVVITDDDFLFEQQAIWCAGSLSRAVQEFQRVRPETPLVLQTRRAGPPAILRGGRAPARTQRAICFLCDRDGRIAGFCVGVPTGQQLIAMAEDADEVSVFALADKRSRESSLDSETEQPDPLVEALHERSRNRVLRHYQPLVQKIDRQTTVAAAAAVLLPALDADRRERFLITGPSDVLRWLSAQQHSETMQYWCEAMLPSIVGQSVDSVWPELAAILWDGEPWVIGPDDADFVDWYLERIATGPVVVSIGPSPPLLGQGPVQSGGGRLRGGSVAAKDNEAFERTQRLLDQLEYRQVGLPAVADLLHHRQDKAVNLLGQDAPFGGWAIFTTEQRPPAFIPTSAHRSLADAVRKLLAQP